MKRNHILTANFTPVLQTPNKRYQNILFHSVPFLKWEENRSDMKNVESNIQTVFHCAYLKSSLLTC